MVLLRAVVLMSLMAMLLAPAALADDDQSSGSTNFSFASGSTSVSVTPPGGSSMTALTCSTIPAGWPSAFSGSQWISTNADCTTGVSTGSFTYTFSFTLPGGASNLALNGSLMVDDSASITLNGNGVSLSGPNGFGVSTFSTTTGFNVGGSNTLTFTVNNAGGPSGLDFVASVTGSNLGQTQQAEGQGNHGQCVSDVAHSHARGRGHGEAVSDAAHSCPRSGNDDDQ